MMKNIDWCNRRAVEQYARELGHGLLVIKRSNRKNYNIVHADRSDIWNHEDVTVVYRTNNH